MRRLSLHVLMIVTVAIAALASLTMLSMVRTYVSLVEEDVDEIYDAAARNYVSDINDELDRYKAAMDVAGMNAVLRQNIFRTDVNRSGMVLLSRVLENIINGITNYVYDPQRVILHKFYTYLPGDGRCFWSVGGIEDAPWFAEMFDDGASHWYRYSRVTHSNHISIAQPILNYDSQTGVWGRGRCAQAIEVDMNVLFGDIGGHQADIYVFDDDTGALVYTNAGALAQERAESGTAALPDGINAQYGPGNAADESGDGWFTIRDAAGESLRVRVLHQSVPRINATVVTLFRSLGGSPLAESATVIWILLLFFLIMALLVLTNYLYDRRVRKLIRRIDGFYASDATAYGSPDAGHAPPPAAPPFVTDELGLIDHHLIAMQERIKSLKRYEYEAKVQALVTRQELLMSCINPHFLYNTLNTISAMAVMEGADSVSEMIEVLSDMFRYSSDVSRARVPLSAELDNAENYLTIQSMRYQGEFTYSLDAPAALRDCTVPKMIVQPLVENAFKHGFKNRASTVRFELSVAAREDGGWLLISVDDNGLGIPPDKLIHIRSRIYADAVNGASGESESAREIAQQIENDGSIGLKNVHQRIRLMYGGYERGPDFGWATVAPRGLGVDHRQGAGLDIMSDGENKGTHTCIRLPCVYGEPEKKGGSDNAQPAYR